MSELKHSPLPWKFSVGGVTESGIKFGKVNPRDDDANECMSICDTYGPLREENAQFIKLACNAHYDLTAQLAAKDAVIAKLREGLEKLKRAITDEGVAPGHHRRIMAQHRKQWPVLWKAIDAHLAETEVGK